MCSTHFECLLLCGKPCESADSIDKMTQGAWEKLKLKSLNWKGIEIGLEMCMIELGPHGKHRSACKLST